MDGTIQEVVRLLADAARQLGVADALPDGATGGAFAFGTKQGDPVRVILTHDAANGCLNLCVRVGDAPADDDALFEELLAQNYLGRATGGAVFAVDPEGAVVLQRDLALAGLDATGLAEAARSVAGLAAAARAALAVRQPAESERTVRVER